MTEPATSGVSRLAPNPLDGSYTLVGLTSADISTAPCPLCADMGADPRRDIPWLRADPTCALDPSIGVAALLGYTAEHGRRLTSLSAREVASVITGWQRAYHAFAARYACVLLSETHGAELAAPYGHLHGHLLALDALPHTLAAMRGAHRAAADAGVPCPTCAEAREAATDSRLVIETPAWIGFVPTYARYPYQVHLVPRAHTADLDALAAAALDDLASVLRRLIRAYDVLYQAPMPYMLGVHQLGEPSFHLRVEVLPVGRAPGKLKYAASGEMGWGMWVNDAAPEAKAVELRALLGPDTPDA